MTILRHTIRLLVKIPNTPLHLIFLFIILMKAKGNKPIIEFLVSYVTSEKHQADTIDLCHKYFDLYYPNKARYIVAITFYILLFLWIF